MARILLLLFQFIPLSVFLAIVRLSDETGSNWKLAFVIGGCLAVVQFVFLSTSKKMFDRPILAVNLFLFVGGVSFLFTIHPILNLYNKLMQSALFVSFLLVGVATTLFSIYGFIGVDHPISNLSETDQFIWLLPLWLPLFYQCFFEETCFWAEHFHL